MGQQDVVFITGCTKGGIGHALAVAFADRNCIVIATGRSLASMKGLDEYPGIEIMQLDVTSDESRRKVVESVTEKYGRIDILVNNAGVHCVAPVAELPVSLLESTFRTNVCAPIGLIQAVIPDMIARRRGKIVNIGSVVAFSPGPWAGGYAASKAAIHALSDSLRVELKPFGIDVITVAPGAIRSNIGTNSTAIYNSLPKWRFYQPWEKSIAQRTSFSQNPASTPAKELAEKVVEVVMKKNPPPCFTYGYLAFKTALFYYLPLQIRDYFQMKLFGLNKVEELPRSLSD
eukprot:c47124_g1_i1 orf=247-1110(+)